MLALAAARIYSLFLVSFQLLLLSKVDLMLSIHSQARLVLQFFDPQKCHSCHACLQILTRSLDVYVGDKLTLLISPSDILDYDDLDGQLCTSIR